MKIINCQVNHLNDPVGFMMDQPVFTWGFSDTEGTCPKESRLQVFCGDECIKDTGWTDLDPLCTRIRMELKPRTEYQWKVSVQSDTGVTADSGMHTFETGKRDEPWNAEWITCENTDVRHPVFCRSFSASKPVKKARLYISGLGLYEASLNGRKIGNEYLTPYCNAYDRWIQVQTFDITGSLKGENDLEVMLGNGWYRGRFGFDQIDEPAYGDTWKLIAEIHIAYEDGSEEVIGTDETWRVRRSKIFFSNIYDGEQRDDTLADLPEEPCFVCSESAVPLRDRLSPPVTVHERITPEILTTPKGETVLDVKQNITGIFRLKVHEKKGTKIHLQFGEILQDGCFYNDNLRSAKAEYIYISDGEEKVIEPHFTFYGYRYVKVEGIEDLKADDFTAEVLHTDFALRTKITTGNDLVNRLIKNTEWGMRDNYLDVPTDCPQRDERMGWTGDAQVFSKTALYLGDVYAFLTKYMYDMAEEQEKLDGLVPLVVPSFGINEAATAWSDATTIIPWNMYLFTGDDSILRAHYPAMCAWVDWLERKDGEDHQWRKAFHFGDWLALDGPQGKEAVRGATEEGFIADIYYRYSAEICADTAEILGLEDDSRKYRQLADKIKNGILEEYYTPSGRCAVMTQTGQLLSFAHGLGDPEKAVRKLKQLLDDNEGFLQTGFIGTPLLCRILADAGLTEDAYRLLLNEKYPGWLYEVKMGATTIWERWNSVEEDGHISGTGMNSLNHYSYGAVVEWIISGCVGLKPVKEAPGFRKAVIRPLVNKALSPMDAVINTQSGTYEIHWQIIDNNHIRMSFTVPFGCEAEVYLPLKNAADTELKKYVRDGKLIVPAGTYEIEYETDEPVEKILTVENTVGEVMKDEHIAAYLASVSHHFAQVPDGFKNMPLRVCLSMNCGMNDEEIEVIDRKIAEIQTA